MARYGLWEDIRGVKYMFDGREDGHDIVMFVRGEEIVLRLMSEETVIAVMKEDARPSLLDMWQKMAEFLSEGK